MWMDGMRCWNKQINYPVPVESRFPASIRIDRTIRIASLKKIRTKTVTQTLYALQLRFVLALQFHSHALNICHEFDRTLLFRVFCFFRFLYCLLCRPFVRSDVVDFSFEIFRVTQLKLEFRCLTELARWTLFNLPTLNSQLTVFVRTEFQKEIYWLCAFITLVSVCLAALLIVFVQHWCARQQLFLRCANIYVVYVLNARVKKKKQKNQRNTQKTGFVCPCDQSVVVRLSLCALSDACVRRWISLRIDYSQTNTIVNCCFACNCQCLRASIR